MQNYQQPMGYQQPYQQPYPQPNGYRKIMKTDRSMILYVLFTLITCGIYSIYFWSVLGEDLNIMATRRDGKKTMHYCLVYFIFSWLTCGIVPLVWYHRISARVGNEARARGIATSFGAGSFWLWYILGSFILVGPFVYMYQLCKTMNMISNDYNYRGM